MTKKVILVWFRNDLRIHDNEILHEAVSKAELIIPVYVFDPRYYGETRFGTQKTGVFRTKFTIESVNNLRNSLQELGGDLIVKMGKPEEVLPQLVQQYNVNEVYHHREVASEETEISNLVETALWKLQVNLKHFIGHTLYHKEDLPFPVKDIPDVFTTFRKKVERDGSVKPMVPSPERIRVPYGMDVGSIPDLSELGFMEPIDDERASYNFVGGEAEGLKRVHEYFWDDDQLRTYKHTRNGLTGPDYSTKLSPWLAMGCLSPRKIWYEIKKYEKERVANESTYWLTFELLWRDYFRFMFKKYGDKFFSKTGFKGDAPEEATNSDDRFEKWKRGETGYPFIDAFMRELNATGYMSNRGRQNVASFLVKDLKVNWLLGAAYFEEKLIDYSPASNWGNWAYIAGVGNDPKEYRHFDILKQAHEYDAHGDFVRLWVPELQNIPGGMVHEPWKLTAMENGTYGPINSYPERIIVL